jgi:hypothetical protein
MADPADRDPAYLECEKVAKENLHECIKAALKEKDRAVRLSKLIECRRQFRDEIKSCEEMEKA